MPDIRATSIQEMYDKAQELMLAHWHELATDKKLMELAPAIDRYRAMEETGSLFALGVWDGDTMVGYSLSFLLINLHYSALKYAHNDVLFLREDYRKGSVGVKLIAATEKAALALGARLMLWHVKPDTSAAKLFPRLGYRVQDIMFSKGL